jgi:hypothetical protein
MMLSCHADDAHCSSAVSGAAAVDCSGQGVGKEWGLGVENGDEEGLAVAAEASVGRDPGVHILAGARLSGPPGAVCWLCGSMSAWIRFQVGCVAFAPPPPRAFAFLLPCTSNSLAKRVAMCRWTGGAEVGRCY